MSTQPPLPLIPAGATEIGAAAAMIEDHDGGRVYVHGNLCFAWDAGDTAGRRLAAVSLMRIKAATQVQVAAAFGTSPLTVWRWAQALSQAGVSALVPQRTGPRRASKLTPEVIATITGLREQGLLAAGDRRAGRGSRRPASAEHYPRPRPRPRRDGGKRTNGVKRHLAVDVNGLLLAVVVAAASIQDRDAAHRLLAALRGRFSTVRLVWADGGYPGRLLIWAKDVLTPTMQIIKRIPGATGFHVRPRIWVVERSFAWINKHRRCVRDYETRPDHHEAMVHLAMITTMTRRLAEPDGFQRPPPGRLFASIPPRCARVWRTPCRRVHASVLDVLVEVAMASRLVRRIRSRSTVAHPRPAHRPKSGSRQTSAAA